MKVGQTAETSSIEVVIGVLESKGYQLLSSDDESMVGFSVKNNNGGYLPAMIQHVAEIECYELSVKIFEGQIQPILIEGMYDLFNSLHLTMPGVVFTYSYDEETGGDIEVSITHFAFDDNLSGQGIEKILVYAEKVLLVSLPVIYCFVMQKPIYSVDTMGRVYSARTRVSTEECLDMLKLGAYGRA